MNKLAQFGGVPESEEYIPYGKQFIDDKDIETINLVMKSDYLTTGPKVNEFEENLCKKFNTKYAISVSNGTAALHLACLAAGISDGDEVITTPLTFAATANAILYCGGKPVFSDIDEKTWILDPDKIKEKINSKTKAIITVDYTGQVSKLDELKNICKEYNLILIEDAAHSIGSKYKNSYVGSIADITTFSFHPVKTITTGEGGAILTNNKFYFDKLKTLRTHGINREDKSKFDKEYPGFFNQESLGYNYRLTDIQAALGISQLHKLEDFISRRKEISQMYDEAFSTVNEIILQKQPDYSITARHLYVIRLNLELLSISRNEIMKALQKENIGIQVHYTLVYHHSYYNDLGYKEGLCPIAEIVSREILTLPLYYSITNEEVKLVIRSVLKVINHFKKR